MLRAGARHRAAGAAGHVGAQDQYERNREVPGLAGRDGRRAVRHNYEVGGAERSCDVTLFVAGRE